ncbi:MAG: hypothetical protein WC551_13205 [Patescibacteria group bacterium]
MTARVHFDGQPPAKSRAYTTWLRDRRLPCALCGRPGDELHHFGPHGLGQKPSDFHQIPVCRACHTRLHSAPTAYSAATAASTESRALWSIAHNLADFLRECEWSGEPVVDLPPVKRIVIKKRKPVKR